MRRALLLFAILPTLVLTASAQESGTDPAQAALAPKRPLPALPYTPSLDVSSLDRTVDACVDFFRYACGGWIAHNPIPPDRPSWSVYAKLGDENLQFLWGLLDAVATPSDTRTPSEQKIGDYFAACMDEPAIEQSAGAQLATELEEIAPLSSPRDLARYLGRLRLSTSGNGLLFGFGSKQDPENSSSVIAFAVAGGLGLPDRDYYLKLDAKSVELRGKYLAHLRRMFALLGESASSASADARAVMRLETALARASLTQVERRDPYKLLHKMDRAQLAALTPAFPWDDYLREQGIGATPVVNVTEPAFFKALNSLLTAQPMTVWRSYLRWQLAHARAPYLTRAFVDEDFDFFHKTLLGVTEHPPRWRQCVQWVDRDLGEALGQVFVARTFSPETTQKTIEMIRLVEAVTAEEIRQLTWMSEATKRRGLEKLGAIVNKVGYPERWRDYSSLDIVRGDFGGNVRRATVFESKRQLAKIGQPVDRGEWQMTPPTVDALYSREMNDITFPAGVLQPPLYDAKLDDAPNYGNTGSSIGHELTHAFDDEGRQFDAQGNLKDWWTKEDAQAFNERLACVQDQYAQYVVVDDIRINSKLTSGEDVADLGGTLLAFLAWRKATEAQRLQPIDGFTPDQRFFIGFAQWACSAERPEALRVRATINPHSPGKYRINGVVANLPEFAEAFQCRAGQPMVREKVCRVW